MRRSTIILLLSTLLFPAAALAIQNAQGWCELGGQTVSLSGLTSVTKVQRSFPSCTVTVYDHGTVNKSTIYSDGSSTPLANPFTAQTNGHWLFYAADAQYDIVLSGGGMTVPFTISDVFLQDILSSFASPPPLGNVTPNTVAATTLTAAAATLTAATIGTLGVTTLTATAGTIRTLNQTVFLDAYCPSPGTYDTTCWTAAIAALPFGGTIQVGNRTYDFGAVTLTLSPSANNIAFQGSCVGNLTTNCSRIVGTASPLVSVAGTNAGTRTSNLSIHNLAISPASFNASQVCLSADHVTKLIFTDATFENCGQAEDLNDYYGVYHFGVTAYNNCGSGGTASTACVRAENRSNPSVRSEQLFWEYGLWQGATHQGTALYAGLKTQETTFQGKSDYGSTSPTFPIIKFYDSQFGRVTASIAAASISGASGVVVLDGPDASNETFGIEINNNTAFSTSSTVPLVYGNFAKWNTVNGNTITSTGSNAGLITWTANSADNVAMGNTNSLSTDTLIADSGTTNGDCNHVNSVAGIQCGTLITRSLLESYSAVIAGKTDGTIGRVVLVTGNGTATGYLEWRKPNGTRLGYIGNSATNVDLELENSAQFTIQGGLFAVTSTGAVVAGGGVTPGTAGGATSGSAALPWSSIYLGNAGTNNIRLTGTSTAARTATLPDNSGTIAELNLGQTWSAAQAFNTTISTTGQFTSTLAGGTAPFVITSTTPVANLTSAPLIYNHSGTQRVNGHHIVDSCTLGTDCAVTLVGAAIYTSGSTYECHALDTTAAAAVKVVLTDGSHFTFTGTGTDVLTYGCSGY
jgi:hypothetical protein